MKMLLAIIVLSLSCATFGQNALPDTPSVQPREVHFFTFRKSWQDPPLRTNRQVARSKMFWLANGTAWVAMVVACRNPKSGEEFHSEAPALAAVTGFSYLGFRFFSGAFMLGPPAYAIEHYSVAEARGR